MERKKMRHFDREFKISAVRMASEEGANIAETARSLGINSTLLYNWKKKYANDGDKAFIGKGHLTELAALRKKLRRSEMENEILKKAVGIFSKEDQNGSDL